METEALNGSPENERDLLAEAAEALEEERQWMESGAAEFWSSADSLAAMSALDQDEELSPEEKTEIRAIVQEAEISERYQIDKVMEGATDDTQTSFP